MHTPVLVADILRIHQVVILAVTQVAIPHHGVAILLVIHQVIHRVAVMLIGSRYFSSLL